MPGSRSYCFTLNNPSFDAVYSLLQQSFKYLIIGFEKAPTTGTPHIQGFIQFYSPKTDMTVRAMIPLAHLQRTLGTPEQNIAYCSKEGVWFEYGEKPTKGGKLTYEQVEAAMKDPHNNMTILRQYTKTYQQVKQLDISQSKIDTFFYKMSIPNHTTKLQSISIDHLLDSIGIPISDLIVVSQVADLAAYEDEDLSDRTVVLINPVIDNILPLYPRGVPIKYKYGFEYHTCKPFQLIIITQFAEILSHYKIYARTTPTEPTEI